MAPPTKRRHRIWWVTGTLLAVVVCWMAFSLAVIQFPPSDQPTAADAIVVLGEPDVQSLAAAERLLDQGVSNRLVLSSPFGEPPLCATPPAGVKVTCFVPDPSTTRGEAQQIARLADQNGWTNIVVITWPTHLSRSRLVIQRCYGGTLQMVDYEDNMDFGARVQENLYQSGAFLKALVQPNC